MSRIAKLPVIIPANIEVTLNSQVISIKSKNSELTRIIHSSVIIKHEENTLFFASYEGAIEGSAQAGTARALVNAMILGVTKGFTKKLQLVGVGYRAKINDNKINLTLGFSHPIEYKLPIGITAECPNQTEIVLRGADKQVVGQVAADLRAYRRSEPYKGKGIHYNNEIMRTKVAKKK
ncbi:50S ribosomal protein L6 [Candidatus Fukatsuia anoeciicola]|uniref:50S ribosomal protein L6 n=1 Tax=Candidatus Fukatsuia anoeciicola TaxID=2994492 RepID=UPI003463A3DB